MTLITSKEESPLHKSESEALRDWICLGLLLVTLLLFWRISRHDFINFDDPQYVFENARVVNGLTVENVKWAFTSLHGGISYWHPLTWLSHQLDCQIFGLHPGAHHLTNLLFHIANAILLFLVFLRMTGQPICSGMVAMLFAIHPLHVESVAWVAERKDVLSCFFSLLALHAYVRFVQRSRISDYLLSLGFFALGLMSKPMVVTLPCVLLLLDVWPLGRLPCSTKRSIALNPKIWHLALEKLPFFVLSIISGALTIAAQASVGTLSSSELVPLSVRFQNALISYQTYIFKTVWPMNLGVLYPFPEMIPLWKVISGGFLLVTITLLFLKHARTKSFLLVGWLWFLGTMLPVIGLIQVGAQGMADRYTYFPVIGLFVVVVWGVGSIVRTQSEKQLATWAAVVVLLLVGVQTHIQIGYWKNSQTLYEHTLKVAPDNPIVHNNLGIEFYRKGQLPEAVTHFSAALESSPRLVQAHINLGNVHLRLDELPKALERYQHSVKLEPANANAHFGLGLVAARQGWTSNAIDHYSRALESNSELVPALCELAAVLCTHTNAAFRNGAKGILLARRACRLTQYRRAECLEVLAAAFAETGQFEDATRAVRDALALSTNNGDLTRRLEERLHSYELGTPFRGELSSASNQETHQKTALLLDSASTSLTPR